MKKNPETQTDLDVIRQLEILQDQPERDPELAAQTRQKYVSAAHLLSSRAKQTQSTIGLLPALGFKWAELKSQINTAFSRKELQPVFAPIVSILIALSLIFGGATATVYAAQDSQPDELLYSVKTLTEDVRMNLTGNPEQRIDLALTYADQRVAEALLLAAENKAPSIDLANRYNNHIEVALDTLALLEAEDLAVDLVKVQIHLRDQDQLMTKQPELPVQALLQHITRHMLTLQGAIEEPLQWQMRYRAGQPVATEEPLPTEEVPLEALDAEDPLPVETTEAYGPGPGEPPVGDDDPATLPGYSDDELYPAPFGYQEQQDGWFHWPWEKDASGTATPPGQKKKP